MPTPAPKPITRHLVLSAQSVIPTPTSAPEGSVYKNPPRESYPAEVLKHRFMPYGSQVDLINDDADVPMADIEVQDVVEPSTKPEKAENKTPKSDKKTKGKKRKGDLEDSAETPAPKKSKKVKA